MPLRGQHISIHIYILHGLEVGDVGITSGQASPLLHQVGIDSIVVPGRAADDDERDPRTGGLSRGVNRRSGQPDAVLKRSPPRLSLLHAFGLRTIVLEVPSFSPAEICGRSLPPCNLEHGLVSKLEKIF